MDVHDIMMIPTMTSITDGHADHTCRGSSMHVNSHVSGLVCRSYHTLMTPLGFCGLWGSQGVQSSRASSGSLSASLFRCAEVPRGMGNDGGE